MIRSQLLQIAPLMGVARADTFTVPLQNAMKKFGIDSVAAQAGFLAQVLHESGNLAVMAENLNYSPAGLCGTFRSHFTDEQADQYGRTATQPANQRMIAMCAYNGRMGNANDTEDGWRFRGRGPIQLTGRANYKRCGDAIGYDLIASPDLLQQPDVGCLAAAWFWASGNSTGKSLNAPAERGDVGAVTRAINGGNNGLVERSNLTQRALKVLGADA